MQGCFVRVIQTGGGKQRCNFQNPVVAFLFFYEHPVKAISMKIPKTINYIKSRE